VRKYLSAFEPTPRLPRTRGERWTVWVLSLVIGGLFAAELLNNLSSQRLSIVFILLFWGPLLVLHELGHAVMARRLGWSVHEIVIGFGRELTRVRYGQTTIRIKALPIEGCVLPSPGTLGNPRLEGALIYAAGPGAELVFILVLRLFVGEQLFQPAGDLGIIFWQSGALAAALGALFNLVPYATSAGVSDGLGIIRSFIDPSGRLATRLAMPAIQRVHRLLHLEHYAEATAEVTAALETYPGNTELQALLAVCLASAGDEEAGLDLLESLGHPADRPPAERIQMLLAAAWVVLLSDDHSLLYQAQEGCERALALDPDNPKANLLLGRVYLERGQSDAAFKALMRGYAQASDPEEEGQLMSYLLLASLRTDRPAIADRFREELARASIGAQLRQRIERALQQA
jgi:tetratricopeptide (TPR) repeat protein